MNCFNYPTLQWNELSNTFNSKEQGLKESVVRRSVVKINVLGLYADILYEAIVGNWEKKKPIWLLVMISSLTKMEVRSRGSPVLDFHLARKALEMSKKIGAVENVSEQCQPLNRLNLSHVSG